MGLGARAADAARARPREETTSVELMSARYSVAPLFLVSAGRGGRVRGCCWGEGVGEAENRETELNNESHSLMGLKGPADFLKLKLKLKFEV